MLKSIQTILKQDKEMFKVPRRVQDLVPVQRIWPDGIFQVGPNKFSKTWKFSDINYQVASEEDKENMFLLYSDILNSFNLLENLSQYSISSHINIISLFLLAYSMKSISSSCFIYSLIILSFSSFVNNLHSNIFYTP